MNYQNQYSLLIAKHGTADKPDDSGYYERHHVLPKSLGGSNDPSNLVYLSGKAHYLAHYLLFKICGVGPMSHAFWAMSAMDPSSGHRHVPNGRSFEVARIANAAAISIVNTGRTVSAETRAKIATWHNGKVVSDDTRAKMSLSWTPERRVKMAADRTGLTHPRAKPVNIYCHYTGKMIAEHVTVKTFAQDYGYNQGNLSRTAHADRSQPSVTNNLHHHKGIYAVYQ
tara:strand:+ start:77 stop:754 length:678 start_codon:yes stop_codon:yes gene_type:complete